MVFADDDFLYLVVLWFLGVDKTQKVSVPFAQLAVLVLHSVVVTVGWNKIDHDLVRRYEVDECLVSTSPKCKKRVCSANIVFCGLQVFRNLPIVNYTARHARICDPTVFSLTSTALFLASPSRSDKWR